MYKNNRLKALEIYVEKIRDYAQYVERQFKAGKKIGRTMPFIPSDDSGNFTVIIDALGLHTELTIKLTHEELRQIKEGSRNWIAGSLRAVEDLSTLNYTGLE